MLNRGNHGQMLFRQPDEYADFLELLSLSIEKFKVSLWGYCLMGNHWHLVAEVESVGELSRWMHWLCNRQVRLVHSKNKGLGGGHIYQGRYKSFPIQDESYLYNVLLYVEANPLRAKLVTRAEDWPWSSLAQAPAYSGLLEVTRPKLMAWDRGEHWHEEVNQPMAIEKLATVRESVLRGAPYGQPQWIANLTAAAGMESTVRPRGRPRKIVRERMKG